MAYRDWKAKKAAAEKAGLNWVERGIADKLGYSYDDIALAKASNIPLTEDGLSKFFADREKEKEVSKKITQQENPLPEPQINYSTDIGDREKDYANNKDAQIKDSLNNKDYSKTLQMVRDVDAYNNKPKQQHIRYDAFGNTSQYEVDKPTIETEDTREMDRRRRMKEYTRQQQIQQVMLKDRSRFDILLQQWGLGRLSTILYNMIGKDPAFSAVIFPLITGKPSESAKQYIEDRLRSSLMSYYMSEEGGGLSQMEAYRKAQRQIEANAKVDATYSANDSKE